MAHQNKNRDKWESGHKKEGRESRMQRSMRANVRFRKGFVGAGESYVRSEEQVAEWSKQRWERDRSR